MEYSLKNKERSLVIASLLKWLPNKLYLKLVYRLKVGKKLDLRNPKGINEKLNWLKVNNISLIKQEYVDKIKAREIVKNIVGEKYIIPVLGVWKEFKDIDFDKLPESFVLKCNHDSGGVKVIRNKSKLRDKDFEELSKFFKKRLKNNLFYFAREYPYKHLEPLIFAEDYLVDESGFELKDYKFYCFNGRPEFYYIASNRGVDTRIDFYDMKCNHLDIYHVHKNADHPVVGMPPHFDDMVRVAEKLSKNFPLVRIDLYATKEKVFFGEFTFFPGGGFYPYNPYKWEKLFGDLIDLGGLNGK